MNRRYCIFFTLIVFIFAGVLQGTTVSDIKISDLRTMHTDQIRLEFSFQISNDSNEVSDDCKVVLSLIDDYSQEVNTLEADIPPMKSGETRSINRVVQLPTTSFLKWYWGKNPTMNYKIKQVKPLPVYSREDEK